MDWTVFFLPSLDFTDSEMIEIDNLSNVPYYLIELIDKKLTDLWFLVINALFLDIEWTDDTYIR